MRKQSLSYHKSHSAAFSQIKNIPTTIWQTCRRCQQNYKVSEMTFVENECEHCRFQQGACAAMLDQEWMPPLKAIEPHTFAYVSEDDGQRHEARAMNWDDILQENDVCSASLDDESVAAVASMQATLGALITWRDDTCVGGLAPRVIESCTCPVCMAIRSLEVAIEHIYRIFE